MKVSNENRASVKNKKRRKSLANAVKIRTQKNHRVWRRKESKRAKKLLKSTGTFGMTTVRSLNTPSKRTNKSSTSPCSTVTSSSNKTKASSDKCDSIIIIDDSLVVDSECNETLNGNDVIVINDDTTILDDSDVIYVGRTELPAKDNIKPTDALQSNNKVSPPKRKALHSNSKVSESSSSKLPQTLSQIPVQNNSFPVQIQNNLPIARSLMPNPIPSLLYQNPAVSNCFPNLLYSNNRNYIPLSFESNIKQNSVPLFNNNRQNYSIVNEFGNNIYNAGTVKRCGLRMVVIDGSNVAMGHSNGKCFSVKGLKICVEFFLKRGHKVVAFVPQFRFKCGESSDQNMLKHLQKEGHVVATPSRDLAYRRICSYDDRYIVQCAAENEGVIVSGDNFRDLIKENVTWKATIEQRLLIPTWVDDIIMFPTDPLGKNGPNLDRFLRFP